MKHEEEPMSDYNNRIKEWITKLVVEELNEDDSWWTSMSADQQADYIKRHPQSQKAQDAKKEKEDEPTHAEIMQHIEDEGYGGDAIGPDGNPTPEAYEDAKQELMYQKQNETITINGQKYKPIKEEKKKSNPHILKEIYDRTFRSLK